MNELTIEIASVKVMRSHDYCHFEVNLSSSLNGISSEHDKIAAVDELRKKAARLTDKAVLQYKIAKQWATKQEFAGGDKRKRLEALAELVMETPDHERTPEEKAIIKGLADERYAARQYDYQDDWDDFDDQY